MSKRVLFFAHGWIAVAVVAVAMVGCGNKEEAAPVPPAYALPEANDANCRSDAIMAMPDDRRQAFAALCMRRAKPVQSPKKSYEF